MQSTYNNKSCPNFKKGQVCIYCREVTCKNNKCEDFGGKCNISSTREEIPPKALFKQNKGFSKEYLNLPPIDNRVVNACRKCNNSYSTDDDYFVNVITTDAAGRSSDIADFALRNKRGRGIEQNPKFIKEVKTNYKKIIDYHTFKFDSEKFDRINSKIIKGFYFKNFDKTLDIEPKFQWYNVPFMEKGVFSYGYVHTLDTGLMVWYLKYYEVCKFLYKFNLSRFLP